jgi:HSP20 family protein
MDKQVRQIMRSFFDAASDSYANTSWCPSADIYHGRGRWLVKFDLAGVSPDDISLSTEGRRLTVAGTRRDFSVLEDQRAYSMEISYNRFERSLELPCDLGQCEIRSECRDGMFLVLIEPR